MADLHVELVAAEVLHRSGGLKVAIDLNAVPPAGIGGVDPMDKAADRGKVVCYGAIGVGGTKMKIHRAAIQKLFTANNLVLTSNNIPIPSLVPARFNVYLRDRTNQTTTLVSRSTSGAAGGNGDSFPVALSTNGQFALFESSASNLVAGDSNNAADIFLRKSAALARRGHHPIARRKSGDAFADLQDDAGEFVAWNMRQAWLELILPRHDEGIGEVDRARVNFDANLAGSHRTRFDILDGEHFGSAPLVTTHRFHSLSPPRTGAAGSR